MKNFIEQARNEKLKLKMAIQQTSSYFISDQPQYLSHTRLCFYLKQGEQGEQEKTFCASAFISD
jgi:hypothetical protein